MILDGLKEQYENAKARIQEIYQRLRKLREELQELQEAGFSVTRKAEGLDSITAQLMQTVNRACTYGTGFRMMESYYEKMNEVINGSNKSNLLSRIDHALAVGRDEETNLRDEESQLTYELQNKEQMMTSLESEIMNAGDSQ